MKAEPRLRLKHIRDPKTPEKPGYMKAEPRLRLKLYVLAYSDLKSGYMKAEPRLRLKLISIQDNIKNVLVT